MTFWRMKDDLISRHDALEKREGRMRLSDLDKPYTTVSYCPYCGNEDRSLLILYKLYKQTFVDVTEAKCTIGCKCCGGKFDCYVLADELVEKKNRRVKNDKRKSD